MDQVAAAYVRVDPPSAQVGVSTTAPSPSPSLLNALLDSAKMASTPAPKPVYSGASPMYTREHVTILYRCSHGELGRMLCRKMVPLPVRVEGQILWHVDEILSGQAAAIRTLERWRRR